MSDFTPFFDPAPFIHGRLLCKYATDGMQKCEIIWKPLILTNRFEVCKMVSHGEARDSTVQEDRMKKAKYTRDLPRRLYTYFVGYNGMGAPSLSKFARECGLTLQDLLSFRDKHGEFRRACEECNEIRRDYLIDNALGKKQDATMTKFILTAEYGMGESKQDGASEPLVVTVEVVGDEA